MKKERYLLLGVLAVAALVGGTTAVCVQVDDHTILYYSFDLIAGGKAPDEAGDHDA